MTEKSDFREAWSPKMTSQSFPVTCFWSRGYVPHRKWNLTLLVHQNTGRENRYRKFFFGILINTLGRFYQANKKNQSYTLQLPLAKISIMARPNSSNMPPKRTNTNCTVRYSNINSNDLGLHKFHEQIDLVVTFESTYKISASTAKSLKQSGYEIRTRYHSLTYPLATSCASPGTLDALEDVSTDSAASLCAKLTVVLFCADLSFCARLATADALRGVLNVRPITSELPSVLLAFALVDASSAEEHKEYTIILWYIPVVQRFRVHIMENPTNHTYFLGKHKTL